MKFTLFASACLAMLAQAEDSSTYQEPINRSRRLRSQRGMNNGRGFNPQNRGEDINNGFNTNRFVAWASKQGKSYSTQSEFQERLNNWTKIDAKIKSNNAKADASGNPDHKRMGHNLFSDMTQSEKMKRVGLKIKPENENKGAKLQDDRNKDRLKEDIDEVDWAAQGVTGPVKDQGACGSCYAFSANTTLEATIAIQTGEQYQRLSEQQIVDCGNWDVTQFYWNYGCEGGYMSEVWWFQMDKGAMTDADYPYISGQTQTEQACAEDTTKYVVGVESWGSVDSSITELGKALNNTPLAIAVAAGNDDWFQYTGGVLEQGDCQGGLDHAVVLVGYLPGQDEEDTSVYEVVETECRRQRWKDLFYDSGCRYTDETLNDGRFCCWENIFVEETESGGSTATWKVQNSWGTEWGDQGFIYLAVEGGEGVCGMNQWVEWVTPKYLN